jgi:hypothetical protein
LFIEHLLYERRSVRPRDGHRRLSQLAGDRVL